MKKKSILAFGMGLAEVDGLLPLPMNSDRSLLDADIVIVEPNLRPFHNEYGDGYGGTPLIDSRDSFLFRKAQQRWTSELSHALASDRTVVYFLTSKEDRHYLTGQTNNTGTPGRPRMTRMVAGCSNYDFAPPIKGAVFSQGSDMKLDPGASVLSRFWTEFGALARYNVYFDEAVGQPLVRTQRGEKVVGALVRPKQGGRILLLPEVVWGPVLTANTEAGERKQLAQFTTRFRDALLELDRELRAETETTEEPEWAARDEHRLNIEGTLEGQIIDAGREIERLTAVQADLHAALRRESAVRGLLYEKGHALEAAVRSGLETLGFSVENFKTGDSEFDALFTADGVRLLGEVEGKDSKPINVDKASQLQRNLGEDFARDEVSQMAVGVLFGNAYRTQDVAARPDEYFTEKVVSFAKVANIALVRTPDLFRVVRALRNQWDEGLAMRCRAAIREGAGKIVVFPEVAANEESVSETAE